MKKENNISLLLAGLPRSLPTYPPLDMIFFEHGRGELPIGAEELNLF